MKREILGKRVILFLTRLSLCCQGVAAVQILAACAEGSVSAAEVCLIGVVLAVTAQTEERLDAELWEIEQQEKTDRYIRKCALRDKQEEARERRLKAAWDAYFKEAGNG